MTLCDQLQIRKTVTILESEIIKIPVVFGHLKPVIFFPLGLLTKLPPEQVEAILIHELAHIRRHDYVVNLSQNMVEILFFFNPALLWISSLIRNEREHCCDDIAIGQTKDKKQFIQALITFKQLSMSGTSSYLPAFHGNKNHILNRAARIVHNENQTLNSVEKAILLSCIVLVSAFTIVPKAGTAIGHGAIALKNNIVSIVTGVQEKPRVAKAEGGSQPGFRFSTAGKDTVKAKHDSLAKIAFARISSKADLMHRDSLVTIALESSNKDIQSSKQRDSLSKMAFVNINKRTSIKNTDSLLKPAAAKAYLGSTTKHRDSLTLAGLSGPARKRIDSTLTTVKEKMQKVMDDLIDDHIISDKNSLTSFELTDTELIVNGIKQPDAIQKKLKAKHLKESPTGLFYGPLPVGMHNYSGIFYTGRL